MAEIRTLTTLTKKRDEISRATGHYEKRLEQARADLAAITAAMVIFQGSPEPERHRAYVDPKRLFRYGEIAKHCLDCLADGKDWTTRQIAIRLMEAKGAEYG